MRSLVLLDEARRRVKVADHMLTMTYPLVKDPKLLLAVLENVHRSMDTTMAAALAHARDQKKIPLYSDTLEGRYAAYRQHFAQKTPAEAMRAIGEIKETIKEHEQSPVEFRRQEKFVICSESYKVRTLTQDTLKKYIRIARSFHEHTRTVIT